MSIIVSEECEHLNLFEELPPMQQKRVAVIIGRFNPPQAGHYKLINDVKKWIKGHPKLKLESIPIIVVIGGSKSDADLKRNPLSVQDRITFMKSSGKCDGIKFLSAPNAFAALEQVRVAGFEPIAVAAGSDRIDGYVTMLDRYYTDADEESIKHYKITLTRDDSAVELDKDRKKSNMVDIINSMKDGEDPSIDKISASLARVAVELNAREEFAKIVGLESNKILADKMFNKIKVALGV